MGRAREPPAQAYDAFEAEAEKENDYGQASDRMDAAGEVIDELADRIDKLDAETIEGLRAKALLVLFRVAPYIAINMNHWEWSDQDMGAGYLLFRNIAELTGLTAFVDHYEAKFDQVAADIEAAGGDGFYTADDDPPAA